jgi:hypothetical protein
MVQLLSFFLLALTVLSMSAPAENWPGFRGPTGQGMSSEKGLPTSWSNTTNIAWKTEIPGEGVVVAHHLWRSRLCHDVG